jgi:hypothetical protein
MEEQWRGQFEGDARRSVDAVIDVDAERWTCPACFETFPRGARRCPGCGLGLG